MNETDLKPLQSWLLGLQDRIVDALAREDGGTFSEDSWQRSEGGGGRSRVLEDGTVIEKGGINFSDVSGISLPASASAHRPELAGRSWRAMGVSLVIHPRNPYVPTAHMNVRFFVAEHPEAAPVWWFGGGFDLTPYYGFDEDCQHWHRVARDALAAFPGELYAQWKEGCDRYFYLKHRQEQRGIGGLFFDDFNTGGWEHCLAVWQAVGEAFLPAYLPILQKRRYLPYGDRERNFQLYRRGRYVEFNLVYDRGTLFGLQSGGRTEAILMSLPREVHWRYQWQPEPGSREEQLTSYYLQPRSWI